MKRQSVLKKYPRLTVLAFNFLVIFFILALFELGLRAFGPSWLDYRMKALSTGEMKDFGSDAGWKVVKRDGEFYSFEPNSTFKMYAFEYQNTAHINALGGRSNEPGEVIDTAELIPFTGDSFVMGVGVEDNESVVALTRKKTGLNLLNLGVTGSGMHFQRKMIEKRYHELGEPSVVIFGFFMGNDFSDILAEVDRQQKHETPSKIASTVAKTAQPSSNTFIWKLNYFVNQNIVLKRIYSLQYIKEKVLSLRNQGEQKVMKPIFYVMDEKNTEFLATASEALEREVAALSAMPFKSIVVVFPDRKQVYPQLRKDVSAYYGLDYDQLNPALPNKILSEVLQRYNIPYIDATECMVAHKDDGALYYTQDNHLTPLGQKVYSECVSGQLASLIKK